MTDLCPVYSLRKLTRDEAHFLPILEDVSAIAFCLWQMIIFPLTNLVAKKLPGAPSHSWFGVGLQQRSTETALMKLCSWLSIQREVLHGGGAVGKQTNWLVRNEKTQSCHARSPTNIGRKWGGSVSRWRSWVGNANRYEKESLARVLISSRAC